MEYLTDKNNSKKPARSFSETLNQLAQASFFLTLTFLVWNSTARIDLLFSKAEKSMDTIQKTSESLQFTADAQKALLQDREVRRSIQLLAQSGDNWSRLPVKIGTTLDQINQETIPRINKTLESIDGIAITLMDGTKILLTEADEGFKELRAFLKSPELQTALRTGLQTIDEINTLAQETSATAADLRAAIPELVTLLNGTMKNTEASTYEIATFLHRINKPLTKKEKLFKVLLYAVTLGAPVIVQGIR